MTTASNDEDDNEGLENDSDDERDQEEGVEEGNQDVVLDPLHDQHPHQYRGTRAFRRREAQIRWANMTAPVDGKLTCGLFQHCHLPQEHGLYCQYHSLSLDRYVTSTSKKPVPSPTLQRHGLKESELESLDTLRGLYSSDKTWIIDFEFISLIAVKSAVPFTVSIRTVQGQGLLDAVIDSEHSHTSTQ
ncbi:hypothetical protein BJ546DRAFT_273026 [Cryomyces antarcticus]